MTAIIQFLQRFKFVRTIMALISAISLLITMVSIGLPVAPRDKVQNVIFLIGDGMGENHLKLAKQELGIDLIMETMPVRGQSETRSFSSAVTDSAAGATALACGIRTINGCTGVYPNDMFSVQSHPENLTELAMQKGMKAGIVTTDLTTGATPAGFSIHTSSRDNTKDIALQEVASGVDLFWGSADSNVTQANVQAHGYKYISSLSALNALNEGEKSFGQFNGEDLWKPASTSDTPTLSQMTGKAISQLENEKGFFLMIEGAHIDKFSHSNIVANAVSCVQEFDKAIGVALDFAKKDGNTLVIVTADHETGAVELVNGKYVYTSGSHSGDNVPLFVYGSDNFIENGEAVKNIDIAKYVAMSMGVEQKDFPSKVDIIKAAA